MSNITAEQAIRKVANSLINTHRPQLGASHSLAIEASLEALAELADELSLLDIYAELTKRLEILQGGQRPHIIGVDMATAEAVTVFGAVTVHGHPDDVASFKESFRQLKKPSYFSSLVIAPCDECQSDCSQQGGAK
ncbi:hypothetical protein JD508_04910 [Aeromonas jandaei]|uniref:hypothetical protein n=1 Tax=Aeromonas jandaei TaxID=650 RepID=UPI00191E0D4B|nr:hypothetical protein [Aeromonas jandaei]MBL0609606.1 hypothetical protein [Aeromonas jandaei]